MEFTALILVGKISLQSVKKMVLFWSLMLLL